MKQLRKAIPDSVKPLISEAKDELQRALFGRWKASWHGQPKPKGITADHLMKQCRLRVVVRIRQKLFYDIRSLKLSDGVTPRFSTTQIASFFEGEKPGTCMDHTTIIHGIRGHMKREGLTH